MNTVLTNNPVLQAELKHQQYVITTSRSGRFWIALAVLLLIPAFLSSAVFVIEALLGVNITRSLLGDGGRQLLMLNLIVMNVALYVVMTLITMGLAANSISREQTGKTWETLLITALKPQQIIMGKWWATLQALWGDHIMLAVMRVGLLAFFAIEQTQILSSGGSTRPSIGFLLLGIVLMLAFTAIEEAFSAAVGLLTPLSGSGWLFLPVLMIRGAVSVGIGVAIVMLENVLPFAEWNITVASVGAVLLLVGLTWVALCVAELVASWGQART